MKIVHCLLKIWINIHVPCLKAILSCIFWNWFEDKAPTSKIQLCFEVTSTTYLTTNFHDRIWFGQKSNTGCIQKVKFTFTKQTIFCRPIDLKLCLKCEGIWKYTHPDYIMKTTFGSLNKKWKSALYYLQPLWTYSFDQNLFSS